MENKEKRERFQRLATLRTKNTLKALKVLSHCANKQAYLYTEHEISVIFAAIEKQLRATKSKFVSGASDSIDFNLKG